MKKSLNRLYKRWMFSKLRSSKWFFYFQRFMTYTNEEKMMQLAMKYADDNKLEGDYLEFGVFEGTGFIRAYHFAQWHNLDSMRFYAFDSFKGLPRSEGIDEGQFKEGFVACSERDFINNISKRGVDMNKVDTTYGWFKDTLNDDTKKKLSMGLKPLKKAAVIFVDCDLYNSTVPVLDFITDYIQDGTLIMFSDWFCFKSDPNRGQQRAFKEWLKKNQLLLSAVEYFKSVEHGNSFIIHKWN